MGKGESKISHEAPVFMQLELDTRTYWPKAQRGRSIETVRVESDAGCKGRAGTSVESDAAA